MSLLWHIYWPVLLAAVVAGVLTGRTGFRQRKLPDDASASTIASEAKDYRRRKNKMMALGVAATIAMVWLWHLPLGGGSRFAQSVETEVTSELKRVDTPEFTARLERSPLSRTLIMSGSANPFQKDGFVRLMREIPGVADVRWSDQSRRFALPLLVEAILLALIGYGIGLFFSWIVEIRRRVNAHWNW